MKRIFLFSIALLCAWASEAQAGPAGALPRIGVEYQGEMGFHPGLRLFADYPISLGGGFSLAPGLELGGYLHPGNLRALQASPIIGIAWRAASGFHAELGAGIGLQWGFVDRELRARLPDLSVARVPDPGRASLIFQSDLRLGGLLGKWGSANWEWLVGPRFQGEYPVNGLVVPRLLLLCGASCSLGGL